MEERCLGKDVIGSVGGVRIPTVDEYIGGYQAGAKAADPRITLLNGYSGDFLNRRNAGRSRFSRSPPGRP